MAGELDMGRNCAQLMELSGFSGLTFRGGTGTGKRWPRSSPLGRSTKGVENMGGAGFDHQYPYGASPVSWVRARFSKEVKYTPNAARMLVWPDPPVSLPRNPLWPEGE